MTGDHIDRQMELTIESWPLDRLMPYARNARTHSDEQLTQIAASIASFGFNNPILVDERDEIIAGHGRALAAERLGLAEVPVIVLAHLTEAQKRAFRLADNRIALLAGWDEELLRLELGELRSEDFDLDEIERLLEGSDADQAGLKCQKFWAR